MLTTRFRIALLVASIPFVVAASPEPRRSAVPADAVALPAAAGSWRATVTITGGFVARFKQYVVASDGRGASTATGRLVLDAAALARVTTAVASARDSAWSIPRESTCCDRIITDVAVERRTKRGRTSAFTAQTAQSGTPLPADASAVVDALEAAFPATPSPGPS